MRIETDKTERRQEGGREKEREKERETQTEGMEGDRGRARASERERKREAEAERETERETETETERDAHREPLEGGAGDRGRLLAGGEPGPVPGVVHDLHLPPPRK